MKPVVLRGKLRALWRWAPELLLCGGALSVAAYERTRWMRDGKLSASVGDLTRSRPGPLADAPRVSIVVAAWNEADLIERHIQSVLDLRYPNVEYVLCAGGSDSTYERAKARLDGRGLVLRQHPDEGKSGALRRCVDVATGEILAFTDADCVVSDVALNRVIAPIVNDGEVAATGSAAPLAEQRVSDFVLHQWAVDAYARAGEGDYASGLLGRNMAITADVLATSNAFRTRADIGEDFELAQTLLQRGYKIRLVSESSVETRFEEHLLPYMRQRSRWLRGVALAGGKFDAWEQVLGVARVYTIGLLALLLPAMSIWLGRTPLFAWLLGMSFATLNRLRYLRFAAAAMDAPIRPRTYAMSIVYAPLDLLVVGASVVELLTPAGRRRW